MPTVQPEAGQLESTPFSETRLLAEQDEADPPWATLRIGLASALAYFLAYFARYPIFMLPDSIAAKPFTTVFGASLTLQEALSVSFSLGFGLAKLPAVSVMTSQLFFRNRLVFMVVLNVLACLLVSLPVALTAANPAAAALGMFLSCFPQSWIYGGMVTYLEGRRSSEILFGVMSFALLFGGSASRGAAMAVLNLGVSPHWMPMVTSGTTLPILLVLLWVLDRSPPPSPADVAFRRPRRAMTAAERRHFAFSCWPGLLLLVCGFMLLSALRNFRDQFSKDIITAANGGETPSAAVIMFVDLPGAVVSVTILVVFVRVQDNRKAFLALLVIIILGLLVMIGATWAFQLGVLPGVPWQVIFAAAMFCSFSLMSGSPVYERLISASNISGATSTFLIFASDFFGSMSSIALLIWKVFARRGLAPDDLLQDFVTAMYSLTAVMTVCLVVALCYFMRWLHLRGDSQAVGCS